MAAVRKNMLVDLGTTWDLVFTYQFDGSPVDLTGHTVYLTVTKTGDSTSIYHTTSIDGPADGTIHLVVSDEETAGWTFGKGAYTVDVIEPDGDKRGLLWGSLTVRDRADV